MIRSWYKESIYYRLYNILVVPYKKLLKKEGEGRAGSRIISSGWLRKKQKMSAIYFKALLQNGCDNWHPCQNALWAKRSSKNSNFLVKYTVFQSFWSKNNIDWDHVVPKSWKYFAKKVSDESLPFLWYPFAHSKMTTVDSGGGRIFWQKL